MVTPRQKQQRQQTTSSEKVFDLPVVVHSHWAEKKSELPSDPCWRWQGCGGKKGIVVFRATGHSLRLHLL